MSNSHIINQYIRQKLNYNTPTMFLPNSVAFIDTDMDEFPYKRFFRGVAQSSVPIIHDREAGYRPRFDTCYKHLTNPTDEYPNNCFEPPCLTILPCRRPKDAKDPVNIVLQP